MSLAPLDPMCTLFFTHLANRLPLRIVQFPGGAIAGAIAGASAVVFVRGLFEFGNLIWCAEKLGVPCYYFLDDNFMLIREEVETYGTLYERYTNDRVRDVLRTFSGVLLATDSLIEYFMRERLHDRLMLYPPVAGPIFEAPAPDPAHRLTIAFFGGLHRREPFVKHVYPAVCRLARERAVTLVAAGIDAGSLPPTDGVEVIYPRYDPSYTIALAQVARYGVDILVHPSSPTVNNIYKNPHVLINAHVIGAVPIFSNMPPYDAVAGEQVALLCEDDEEAWFDALKGLADDPQRQQRLRTGLAAYCERQFGGDRNADVIGVILRAHPRPDAAARIARRLAVGACVTIGHSTRRLAGVLAGVQRS